MLQRRAKILVLRRFAEYLTTTHLAMMGTRPDTVQERMRYKDTRRAPLRAAVSRYWGEALL